MFEMKPIARQVLFACGSLASAAMLAGPVSAQTPPPPPAAQPQSLERVTITGSNIRRTDTETVAPVEIITREQIERSGKPTVAEVLRSVSSNTGGSFDESFSNSFAAGASGISLRGLGQKTTLVLINGRRVSGYGFAQNLQDSFVDLNSIPTSAVERIEILKDGASAIYGSDAIAGVVNVILRRDFKGAEIAVSGGQFSGKNDYSASIGAGAGDLGSQKFNVFGVLDFYKRDLVQLSDTPFGKDRDYRDKPGGRNYQSATGAGTWTGLPGSPTANVRRAIAGCAALGGQVVNYQEAVLAGLIGAATDNPASPNSLANLLAAPVGTGFNLPGNTWCKFDFNSQFTAVPGTQRVGFLSRATVDFSPTTQGYVELGLSRNETEQKFQSPFFNGTTGLQQVNGQLLPFTYNVNFLPGAAGNPTGVTARLGGVLVALGTRDAEITSDTSRILAGLKYSLRGWDLDSGVGYSKNEVNQKNINRLSKSATNALLGINPTIAAPTGTVAASACNFDQPLATLAACRSILIDWTRTATSELTMLDTKATTELGQLPGGAVGLALGIDYRNEKINDSPQANALAGDILGQGTTRTDGSRHNVALFSELALPLTQMLEMQLALRSDRYSDFGSALTPKAGLKFKPAPEFLLRANWGRGFRAPSLPEISPSDATFFTLVGDPLPGVPTPAPNISGSFKGNPGLKAEKSRSSTLGFVWEPNQNFNVSVDWYEISWSNIVGADSFSSIVGGDVFVFGRQNDATCSGGDPRVVRDPTNSCAISTVTSAFRNLSRTTTRGVDLDLRQTVRSSIGRFVTRMNVAYVDEFEEEGLVSVGRNDGSNTIPRIKGALSLEWEQGPWTLFSRINYIHHYYNAAWPLVFGPSAQVESTANRAFQNGAIKQRIHAYTTLDAFGRYAITPKFSISGSISNIFDYDPPLDPGFSTANNYDFSQYNVLGRTYRIGATYKF